MYEVELKVRAEHAQVRDRLDALDATAVGTVRQEDTYYDAPDRNFAETDEALRVRRETGPDGTDRLFVTYKGPLVDTESKTREEAETRVEDEAIREVLTGLGYEHAATVVKERERYVLEECTVTLDDVEGIGEFVEVELETDREIEQGDSEAGDRLESLRGEAADVMESLGLDPGEQIRTSYLGLVLETAE